MDFPVSALDYPWSKPRLPGSSVTEASLNTADSSPQPASPSLWKVSFNHCGGGGGREGGRWRRQWGWRGGEWLGTTAILPCRPGQNALALPSVALNIEVSDGCLDGRERGDGDRSPVRSKQDEIEGYHLCIRTTKHFVNLSNRHPKQNMDKTSPKQESQKKSSSEKVILKHVSETWQNMN